MKSEENKAMNTNLVNNSPERKLLQTADGSWTIHIPEVEETYHSRHGAMQESMHVFIQHGLHYLERMNVRILEVGLGTGLNVILTLENKKSLIEYHALEPYPIDQVLVYELISHSSSNAHLYQIIHDSQVAEGHSLSSEFIFKKHVTKFFDFEDHKGFDIIYYDAFGPRVEPSLWTAKAMQRCYEFLNPGGVWVSYCAKGEVRRNLVAAGFTVDRLPGPPGKREMLRAKK
jgi:tRNA U34 5-methylaminomethyl-2-thiouridine-forming methyltransferase MnmC